MMGPRRQRLLLVTVVALSACVKPPVYNYAAEPDPRKAEYVIGVGDTIQINVWKTGELNTTGTVRPDGIITMPLVGDLKASGKTPSQLKVEITERVSLYIKGEAAPVAVAVTGMNSYRWTMQGNFERNGLFTERRYVTVSEAIANAGGVGKFGNAHKVFLIRRGSDGRLRRIPIDYTRIQGGEHPEEDLVIITGDVLFAP